MGHAPPHRVCMRQVPEIVGDLLLPTRPDHKVPVVLHQTPTDDTQRRPRVRLQHDPHEGGVVFIVAKQSDTPRRTIRNMIYISAGTMTRFSSHAILLAQDHPPVNTSCVPVSFPPRFVSSLDSKWCSPLQKRIVYQKAIDLADQLLIARIPARVFELFGKNELLSGYHSGYHSGTTVRRSAHSRVGTTFISRAGHFTRPKVAHYLKYDGKSHYAPGVNLFTAGS